MHHHELGKWELPERICTTGLFRQALAAKPFVLLLISYTTTIFGNVSIMMVCILIPSFTLPCISFLANLSILDLCYTTSTVPHMLDEYFSQQGRPSAMLAVWPSSSPSWPWVLLSVSSLLLCPLTGTWRFADPSTMLSSWTLGSLEDDSLLLVPHWLQQLSAAVLLDP